MKKNDNSFDNFDILVFIMCLLILAYKGFEAYSNAYIRKCARCNVVIDTRIDDHIVTDGHYYWHPKCYEAYKEERNETD